ncbi:MAG: SPASM domain-containing protein, partial [bacterium]
TNLNRKDDGMWLEMVKMGFQITFSCDGATPRTFESIRHGSWFERILSNLEVISKERKKLKQELFHTSTPYPLPSTLSAQTDKSDNLPELCFLVTLQPANYREMPLFIDLASRYGAEKVVFSNVQGSIGLLKRKLIEPVKRAVGAFCGKGPVENLCIYNIPRQEIAGLKAETVRRAKMLGISVSFIDNFLGQLGQKKKPGSENGLPSELPTDYLEGIGALGHVARYKKCFKPFSYVVINYRGDVGPCNHLLAYGKWNWERMGNIRDADIMDIWNSRPYREFRSMHLSASPINSVCKWCYSHRVME